MSICPLLDQFVNRNETRVLTQDAERRFSFCLNAVFNSVASNKSKTRSAQEVIESFIPELGADRIKVLAEKLAAEHIRKVRR